MDKTKEILNRLEQLVLKNSEDTRNCLEEYGEDSLEYQTAEAYDNGAFVAFAIAKKVVEGDYE